MGERKAPTPPPTDQGKPEPPPAPPAAGHEARTFPIQSERGAKPHPTRIPWWLADLAYSVYRARFGSGQSLERLAERGGFHPSEMDEYVPDWRDRAAQAPPAGDVVPPSDTKMTRAELIAALAECYRLTGADPDGNEDWRLAEDAVKEVRRLRHEVERLEAAPNGQAYLVDLKQQAEGQR